jgi:hypothetical protein
MFSGSRESISTVFLRSTITNSTIYRHIEAAFGHTVTMVSRWAGGLGNFCTRVNQVNSIVNNFFLLIVVTQYYRDSNMQSINRIRTSRRHLPLHCTTRPCTFISRFAVFFPTCNLFHDLQRGIARRKAPIEKFIRIIVFVKIRTGCVPRRSTGGGWNNIIIGNAIDKYNVTVMRV